MRFGKKKRSEKNRILILTRARFRRQALALLPRRKEDEYFGGLSYVLQRS